MKRRTWLLFVVPVFLILVMMSFAMPATAGKPGQQPCGNACGIPGCSACHVEDGESRCDSWCGDSAPPTAVPTEEPTQQPTVQPPGGDNPTPTPAPGETPTPSETPTPEPGMVCYDCVPWPYCSGYADDFCVVTDVTGRQWISTWSCMGDPSVCEAPPSDDDDDTPEPPCVPEYNEDGFDLNQCDGYEGWEWGYHIWVSARVPPHRVQVDPFPRWLVAMGAPLPPPFESGEPGRLILMDYPAYTPPGLCAPNGPGFSEGCWSDPVNLPDPVREEPEPGDVRGFRIGLRWRRVRNDQPNPNDLGPVPPVCWDFDEREWNIGKDYGYGRIPAMECGSTIVTHIYETSSWGKPHNGPRFIPKEEACPPWDHDGCCEQVPSGDGEWDMPAYQVKVYTTWAAEWAVQWDEWEQVGTEWSPEDGCFSRPEGEPLGIPHRSCPYSDNRGCNPADPWCGQIGEPVYDWVHHFEGWHPIDLRDYGSPTWYYTSWAVVTTGAGAWCEWEYADPNPGDTVRVPVIEVQSVLRDPCVIDDSCPPGYPGPGNLQGRWP